MKTKLRPLADNIVVEPQTEEKTKGGIVLPESAKEDTPAQGKVIAVGPGRLTREGKRQKPEVKAGEKILFKKYAPTEVEIDGQEYLILSESDVLAIID